MRAEDLEYDESKTVWWITSIGAGKLADDAQARTTCQDAQASLDETAKVFGEMSIEETYGASHNFDHGKHWEAQLQRDVCESLHLVGR